MEHQPEELTVVEAAERYQESPNTLRSAIRRGQLVSRQIGSGRHAIHLIQVPEIERYIAERSPGARKRKGERDGGA